MVPCKDREDQVIRHGIFAVSVDGIHSKIQIQIHLYSLLVLALILVLIQSWQLDI
jgi:hypothetical protein